MQTNIGNSQREKASRKTDIVRCAIYARCASGDQSTKSIARQIRKCTEYAKTKGCMIANEFVRADVACSGRSLTGRHAILALMNAAQQRPKPFGLLLIDHTSRLSRSLEGLLHIVRCFGLNGVRIIATSQGLDLTDEAARNLLICSALIDEQYLDDLGARIGRGRKHRGAKQ